jgi:TatD DNase family protein
MFDSHAHLNHSDFQADRPQAMDRARAAGLTGLVNVGWDLGSSRLAADMARPEEGVYAAVGIHPQDVAEAGPDDFAALRGLCGRAGVVAVGETGLDFYRDLSPRPAQMDAFRRHAELAAETGLALIVHDREAHEEVLGALAEGAAPGLRVVLHCYSAGPDLLDEAVARGYFIGLAGSVTFPKATGLRGVARRAPAEGLLVETDCPYLAPQGHRGRRNEPAYLRETIEAVALARGELTARVEAQTEANARAAFGLAGR